jgi:hypothetical protein
VNERIGISLLKTKIWRVLGLLLISVLVCHIVILRRWVVLWVRVMVLHGS